MNSAAYAAQPDFAKVVLLAVAARYHGRNNGDLSLAIKDARVLGVAHPWKLYAGINLLRKGDLIECTRQGRLERGTKLCSLFAVTWRGIDAPPDGVAYDTGISSCAIPSHAWAKWEKPATWIQTVREVTIANHGRNKIPVSTTLGKGRSTTLGKGKPKTDQPPWVKESTISVPRVVDTSKTLAAEGRANRMNGHVPTSKSPSSATAASRKNRLTIKSTKSVESLSPADRIHKAIAGCKGFDDAAIARTAGVSVEEVRQVRSQP